MKYKIGIFGSSAGELNTVIPRATELGEELGRLKKEVIVITGAASGLPYKVALSAYKKGTAIWGYSPKCSKKDQIKETPEQNLSIYSKIFYIPNAFRYKKNVQVCRKYRNVISTANCDAGIIISGRWGTVNEFTNLFDMGKVIGVLSGTGGFADELPELMKKITKQSKAVVLFDSSPKKLVSKILTSLSI